MPFNVTGSTYAVLPKSKIAGFLITNSLTESTTRNVWPSFGKECRRGRNVDLIRTIPRYIDFSGFLLFSNDDHVCQRWKGLSHALTIAGQKLIALTSDH